MREDIVKIRAKVRVTVCAWRCKKIRAMVRGFVQRHAQMCAAVCRDYDMCR